MRAERLLKALLQAKTGNIPLRVIVNTGTIAKLRNDDGTRRVAFRKLDPMPWHVDSCDPVSGACTLSLGPGPGGLVDQFSLLAVEPLPARRSISGEVFARSPGVRESVLARAAGRCEHCGELGFVMRDGRIYLETHHVIRLSEGGPDWEDNVVAMCPNHHREAHFGCNAGSIRKRLQERLAQLQRAN